MATPEKLDNIDISLSDSAANLNFSFNFKPEISSNTSISHASNPLIVRSSSKTSLLKKGGKNLDIDLNKNYYHENKLIEFYVEAFAKDTSKKYMLQAVLTENDKMVLQRFIRFSANNNPLNTLMNFPLATLKKGNHSIKCYVYNDQMQCLDSNSIEFNYFPKEVEANINQLINERSFISSVTTSDSLDYLISCLHPIANKIERIKIQDRSKVFSNLEERKIFFYDFWESRNKLAPDKAWQDYLIEVKKVNDNYGTSIKEGFETDRGRIYLQYGAPNSIAQRPSEPESYPYEIWHYYKVGKFNNIRFVFYLPDMVTNDYQLLHSDMPQELNNPRWRVDLQNRNNKNPDIDNTNPGDSFGSRSQDLYANPR
jgi:GWxTD domain-containing protein